MCVASGTGSSRSVASSAIPNRPSEPTKPPSQSGPRARAAAAEPHDLAVGQHGLDGEHVAGRHAVLEAVRAAGVEGDVAADRADRLARRVGRVEQAVRGGGARDVRVDHARLDDRDALVGVEPQDPVEPVEADHDAALDRQRAARQARAAAARHERDALAVAGAHGLDRPPRASPASTTASGRRRNAVSASDSYGATRAGSVSSRSAGYSSRSAQQPARQPLTAPSPSPGPPRGRCIYVASL